MDGELKSQFFGAIMRIRKMDAMFSAECAIQMNELAILQSIAGSCECEERCGMNLNVPDIQKRLHISKPAVSYILNTLEKKKYITREIDPKDRRKISINATPEGKAAAEDFSRRFDGMWDLLLARFGEEDMRRLVELLMRLMVISGEICEENGSEC